MGQEIFPAKAGFGAESPVKPRRLFLTPFLDLWFFAIRPVVVRSSLARGMNPVWSERESGILFFFFFFFKTPKKSCTPNAVGVFGCVWVVARGSSPASASGARVLFFGSGSSNLPPDNTHKSRVHFWRVEQVEPTSLL